ncbi:MAG: hypothetical protein JRJ87_22655 [Deltaproteobacteria bacterium]|nr:hypothetical protein [Deltaproteobacteria bacterium]
MRRILLLVVLSVAGCAGRFDSTTLVERLRVLGVRAEPPSVGLNDDVELSALVVDPAGAGRTLSATWKVCLVDPREPDTACEASNSLPIEGNQLSVTLTMTELVAWLADMGINPGDFPLQELTVLIALKVSGGLESVKASKRLILLLNEEAPGNQNPFLDGFLLNGEDPGTEPIVLPTGSVYTLKPVMGPGSREWFLPPDEQEQKQEEHLFNWYSTGGSFSDGRTILDTDNAGNNLDINEWTLPEEPGIYTLWLVLRDGRYGIDWLAADFEVVAQDGS